MSTHKPPRSGPAAELPRIAIIVSRYNGSITGKLLDGAREAFKAKGGDPGELVVFDAPGTYELPALALAAADTGRYRGIVALGCLIKGETRHDRYIADAVAKGLMQVTLQTGVPVSFGVLTVDSPKQARARAGGEQGNRGADAMTAVLETVRAMDAVRDGTPRPTVVLTAKHDKASHGPAAQQVGSGS